MAAQAATGYRVEVRAEPHGFTATVIQGEARAAVPCVRKSKRGILRAAAELIRELEAASAYGAAVRSL
jgi:hypothetical protein